MVPTSHWFAIAMIAWFIVAGFDVWYIEKKQSVLQKIIAEKGGMRNEQERKPHGCAADGGKGSAA